ncbi:MAG: S24/S26 family peptidase [Terriglobia bacterium]|jgi:hypothetical protein
MNDRRNEVKGELFRETLKSSGQARLAVTGTSMLPSIWPGDALSVRRQKAEEIRPGDLVLYTREGQFVAHRVVEVRGRGQGAWDNEETTLSVSPCPSSGPLLITRGDRLRKLDPPVTPQQLLGRVTGIERNGRRVDPRLTPLRRLGAWLLCRSEFCARVALHCHRILSHRKTLQDLPVEVTPHPSHSG